MIRQVAQSKSSACAEQVKPPCACEHVLVSTCAYTCSREYVCFAHVVHHLSVWYAAGCVCMVTECGAMLLVALAVDGSRHS